MDSDNCDIPSLQSMLTLFLGPRDLLMDVPTTQLSRLLAFLIDHRETTQLLICAAGTSIGIALIIFAVARKQQYFFGRFGVIQTIFVALLVLGCLSYLAPLRTLNGDGAVHQAKIWFVADAIRHGALPEWTFFWFGGGLVSECYGPLYYVAFAIPMILFGISTKWSIALIVLACSALSAMLIVRALTPQYGYFAAALAAGCHLFSPARAATYWYDGTPHRLVIVFICLVYILYLWRNISNASAYKIGLGLGLASGACVYFHLQFGGFATAILFLFTAVTMTFEKGFALLKPAWTCVVGLLVFLPTAGLHYLYYFSVKSDLVADADSLRYMLAPNDQWLSNLLAASTWDWSSSTWDVHFIGYVPLLLSILSIMCLFHKDRFSFFSGMFAVVIYCIIPVVPRIAVFAPIFFVPTVAAMISQVESWFPGGYGADARSRYRWLGAGIALAVLLDIYPSNFQMPYRPGSGDQPVAKALADMGTSRGRIVVVSPDKQYPNMSADRFPEFSEVRSPSIFGPTFQLSTKMLGYAAMIATQAWREFEATRTISSRTMGYFALLDVSDVLIYKRDEGIIRVQVPNFRPAWRIDRFICDSIAGPLTKLNWDDMRALGLGEKDVTFDNDTEIVIGPEHGVIRGIRLDCTNLAGSSRVDAESPDVDKVTDPRYNDMMSSAEFEIDTSRSGLFLLPFGYIRDILVERNDKQISVHRTNEWMSVVEIPAGHSVIRITAPPRQIGLRRTMDIVFAMLLLGVALRSVPPRWMWRFPRTVSASR
jgi:hypothetical protein